MKDNSFMSDVIGIGINVKLINGSLEALKSVLDKVKEANFNVVELPLHGLDVIIGGKIKFARLKEIKNILRNYPFKYCLHCPESLNLMNIKEMEIEKSILKSSIEFAGEIEAHIFVYHPGRYKSETEILMKEQKKLKHEEKEKLKKIERDILKEFSLLLKEANITLCMENARPFIGEKNYTYAESIEELVKQVEKINDENIKINLDFGHAYLSTNFYKKDFLETIFIIKPYLKYLHIHDNFGWPSYYQEKDQDLLIVNGRGDMHMPPTWGSIPFEKTLKMLYPINCLFVIELRPRYFEYIKESKDILNLILKRVTKN